MTMAPKKQPPDAASVERPAPAGTRALMDELADGAPEERLKLGDILSGLGPTAFGMLLFLGVLPAFIPIPGVGGAVGGPLVVLVGLQLLIGLRRLWLPGFIARRGPARGTLIRFRTRISPWLRRLEKLVRPRMTFLLDHWLASFFTGLLLVLLGILLALPLPFTNYVFGVLLLLFALALLERDGALMLVAWTAGSIAVAIIGIASGQLAAFLKDLLSHLA